MIHTAELFTYMSSDDIFRLTSKYNESITLIGDIINKKLDNGIKICFRNCSLRLIPWQINVFIDVIKLLNKSDISDTDYIEVQEKIDKNLSIVFDGKSRDLILKRIEYRFDVKVGNQIEKETLLHMYRKINYKLQHKFKKDIMRSDNPRVFAGTIYLESKSITSIIYDKEKEREDKGKEVKQYEKSVLRYEVKIKNRHLNYNKKAFNMEKTLETYFNSCIKNSYMKKHLEQGLYKGDYYKLYRANNIINSSDLSDKDKKIVKEFLIDVSNLSITGAKRIIKENGKEKYTDYKFKKIIVNLDKLNINPILIPKNFSTKYGKAPSYIKNPFKYN